MEQVVASKRTPSWREPRDICDWLETHFWIENPYDIETGKLLKPGPIRLFPFQKRILRAATEKDADGKFLWSTVVYSTIKKVARPASLREWLLGWRRCTVRMRNAL